MRFSAPAYARMATSTLGLTHSRSVATFAVSARSGSSRRGSLVRSAVSSHCVGGKLVPPPVGGSSPSESSPRSFLSGRAARFLGGSGMPKRVHAAVSGRGGGGAEAGQPGRRRVGSTAITAEAEASPGDLDGPAKLATLRALMRECAGGKGVDALIVPTDDPHQSEYVARCFARREYLSGFTGSAGTAIVTQTHALQWTDGRYHLQAERELGEGWTLMRAGLPQTPDTTDYLTTFMDKGARIGIDAQTLAAGAAEELRERLAAKKMELVCLEDNLVDEVWGAARPPMPAAPLRVHALEHAGVPVTQKLEALRGQMRERQCEALVVSTLDQIAWLLNVRGGDISYCPVTLSYVVVQRDKATLYVDESKVTPEVAAHLAEAGVTTRPYSLSAVKEDLSAAIAKGGGLWVDTEYTSLAVLETARACVKAAAAASDKEAKARAKKTKKTRKERQAEEAAVGGDGAVGALDPARGPQAVVEDPMPLQLAKAVKNEAELTGLREAHLRDGAAMAAFFCWLDKEIAAGHAVSEVDIGAKLIELRSAQPGFIEPSFATIAGAGPNGAIIHYRAQADTCRQVTSDDLLLLDSGAQYDCGTTDVTRTQHLGEPSAYQRECYTRVLKGNVGLDTAVFPPDTPGFMLDSFARRALWEAGLDYLHGTGHGVGAALNVHEGPQSISPRFGNMQAMMPGMVVSNEPGYYENGKFGIRIENLLVVTESDTPNRFGGRVFMGFDALTLIPIQKKMIMTELLTPPEVAWIDGYHAKVWERISPRVEDAEVLDWLRAATAPLEVAVPATA